MNFIVRTWRGLPRPARWALILFAAVGVGLGVRRLLRKTGVITGGVTMDRTVLDGLKLGAKRIDTIAAMLDQWREDGRLTPDEQAALLAVAYKEGGFNLKARSPDGAPDAKGGHAWGTFQFLATTLKGLGLRIEDVSPQKRSDGSIPPAELARAAQGSAKAALAFLFNQKPKWAGGRTYLEAVREMHGGDPFLVAREIFTAWNVGPYKWRWADIERKAPSNRPGDLGYVHYTVSRKLDVLNTFRRALSLPELSITKTV